jgi:hypothetical protein
MAVQLWTDGQEVTPSPQPSQQIQVRRAAPVITSVTVVRSGSSFEVRVVGSSSPREVTQAAFEFTQSPGADLQTTQVTVPAAQVTEAFEIWYQDAASADYGSTFQYTQPFTITGDSNAVASVAVTLSNSSGTSERASAGF